MRRNRFHEVKRVPGNPVTALFLAGSRAIRFAMLVLAAGLLLAGIAVPVRCTEPVQDLPADGQFAIRQAYIGWLAAKQEAGMDATIRYITEINGNPSEVGIIRDRFSAVAERVMAAETPENLERILQDFRVLTRQFRERTEGQLEAAGRSREDLAAAAHGAFEEDAGVQAAEDHYWNVRMEAEPASFDRYIRESQATLLALREYGYTTDSAQEELGRISAMRGEFVSALQSQDYAAAEIIREHIGGAAARFEGTVRGIRVATTPSGEPSLISSGEA